MTNALLFGLAVALLVIGVIVMAEVELRRFRRQVAANPPIDDEPLMTASRAEPEPASVDDLHAKYHALGEVDPRKAAYLKYVEQLARHGQ